MNRLNTPKPLACGSQLARLTTFMLTVVGIVAYAGLAWAGKGATPLTGPTLQDSGSRLLTLITFFPVLGAVILLLPPVKNAMVKWVALAISAVPLALSVVLWQKFDASYGVASGTYGIQFIEYVPWIKSFNIEYFMGVDGISITMVLLTTLISFVCILASFGIEKYPKGYFALFLLLQTGMTGLFCSLDLFLFFVFWEVMLLPMYFLIGVWGSPPRVDSQGRTRGGPYSAIKFFLYTMAGSVLMLLGIIALYFNSDPAFLADGTATPHTFNIMYLIHHNDFAAKDLYLLGMPFTKVIWVGFFIGFAIKVPMFPFHTWLPDAHVDAPTPISVILAGVLLKMGIYGMLRINWPMLPDATMWAIEAVAVFGMINIVYGAFAALGQHRSEDRDLKKMIAYSSVSHMGFCLLGMSALTPQGISGAVLQMFNHGTITAQLFLLVGVIYDRAHHRRMDGFGGLASQMPIYSGFVGLAWFAALGLPGLSGFISEALVFLGAFPVHRTLTIISATSVVITAGYMLWSMQRMFLGAPNEKYDGIADINMREILCLAPLVIIVVVMGFYPMPVLDIIQVSLGDVLTQVHEGAAIAGKVITAAVAK
jgi:NADH-quinone oxidoreductase subunit M